MKRKTTLLIMLITLCITIAVLLCALRYFNHVEIETLVDNAQSRNLTYELTIHNPLTGDYSFKIIK